VALLRSMRTGESYLAADLPFGGAP